MTNSTTTAINNLIDNLVTQHKNGELTATELAHVWACNFVEPTPQREQIIDLLSQHNPDTDCFEVTDRNLPEVTKLVATSVPEDTPGWATIVATLDAA